MLTLAELRRALPRLETLILGHRIQAIKQIDAMSVALTSYGGAEAGRRHVRLSCRPGCARVSQLERPPRSISSPPAFLQSLRAHVDGARVDKIRLIDGDRQLAIRLCTDQGDFDLLLTILGPRSNLYLLKSDGAIAAAMRPLSTTRPELKLGDLWSSPKSEPPSVGSDRFEAVDDDQYLLAVEAHYAEAERSEEIDELQRKVERALRKEVKALDRKLAKLEESLEEAKAAPRLERDGELLKSVLSQIKRGDSEVIAHDFDTGEAISIALDPKLTPPENLERLFKRYRKAVRSLTKAGARHEAVQTSRNEVQVWVDRLREIVEQADGAPEELEAFAAEPGLRRLIEKYTPTPPAQRSARSGPPERKLGKQSVPNRLMPRRYQTAGGLEIWVGRSAAGNDYLSMRLARGKDLFFHLDGAPGSHVILRTEGRSDPPPEAVLDACELAVHFSKFKNATRADVHAVPIANVRKPKGSKPGLVTVHGGKTIHLRRTESRLERVLAARVDG